MRKIKKNIYKYPQIYFKMVMLKNNGVCWQILQLMP